MTPAAQNIADYSPRSLINGTQRVNHRRDEIARGFGGLFAAAFLEAYAAGKRALVLPRRAPLNKVKNEVIHWRPVFMR